MFKTLSIIINTHMCADWLIYPMILLEAVAKNHTFHKFFLN